jgi:hypothetical protein
MTKMVACLAALLATAALAEIPEMTSAGIPLFRTDASAIQMLLNTSIKAGATNADGKTMITAGSDPAQAIAAAAAEWSGIPSALINFLPARSTSLTNNPSDGNFVLTIQDTPANRSVVGSFLAITLYSFSNDGSILDSDIVFNPSVVQNGVFYPLSTDHSNGSYDLQALVAHELGHSLGSTHSPVISATMFQSQGAFSAYNTVLEATLHQVLSADDVAFATTRYPAPGAAAQLGSIAGKVAFSTGGAVAGALLVAVNPASGTTIGGLASTTDGSYRLDSLPPGSYFVYAQPANGPVAKVNISGVPNTNAMNTNFRVTFAGGNTAPSAVPVTAGQTSAADISVDPAPPQMQVALIGTGSAGGADWTNIVGPKASTAGSALDLLLWGNGLDSSITADQIRLIGPGITMRTSSLHQTNAVSQPFTSALRFTVDVAPSPATFPVTVAVAKGTDAAVYSGGFVIASSAPGCSYTLSSKQFSLPAAAGQGTVTVTVTAGSGCGWTAGSSASWLKITSTTAVAGNGSVYFAADPNVNAVVRSATLTVAGQVVVVDQAAALPASALSIAKSHNGNFTQGQSSAAYPVTVSNQAGAGATTGLVTVTETVPSGLMLVSMAGSGWTCPVGGTACTRSDPLSAGASYPVITVTVNVGSNATSPQVNSVAVSGGGSATANTTDSTVIASAAITELFPDSAVAGGAGFTIYVIGSGFQSGATIFWNGQQLSTSSDGYTQFGNLQVLTATVPPAFIATAGTVPVTVTNPGQAVSNTCTFRTLAAAAPPVLTSAKVGYGWNASGIYASGDVAITGTSLEPGAILTWNGTSLGAIGSNGPVETTVPLTLVQTPGMVSIAATNPAAAPSSAITLTVPSLRTLTSISPASVAAGSGGLTLTVNGSGFVSGDSVTLAPGSTSFLSTQFVSSSQLQASAPASAISAAGTLHVGVHNSTSNGGFPSANQLSLVVGSFPNLSIAKTHSGNFSQGQTGAAYILTVSNSSTTATSGTVTVTDNAPAGLAITAMSGVGWTCATLPTCTRSDALAAGSTYQPITVRVNVAANASSPQVNQVSVFGGGSATATATDSTIINLGTSHPAFFTGEVAVANSVYSLQLADGNPFGYYGYLASGWIYHFDLGYEYVAPGNGPEVYIWDLSSGHWWYTNTSQFPYLYDFTLNAWIYYFPDTRNAGHYTTNPRYFANMSTNQIFTM